MSIILKLPWPPTVNTYYRNVRGKTLISKVGREYRNRVINEAAYRGVAFKSIPGRLKVEIIAHPPDRRRRDLDNILKSLHDAITHAGVWQDDSQIDEHCMERAAHKGGVVWIRISQAGPAWGTSPDICPWEN